MTVFCALPIRKKAVFVSYHGKYSNCSPRAIYEELRRQMPECRYIWLMRDTSATVDGAEVVKFNSVKAIYHLATSVLWVDNSRKPVWTVKRKGQYYVQTWHGNIALKKVEGDAESKLPAEYVAEAKHDSECADLFISGCRWRTNNFRTAFWYDKEVLEYGLPRSDVLYRGAEEAKARVRDFYGLPENVNIVLYAPTFRNSYSLEPYLTKGDCDGVLTAFKKRYGGDWVLILRLHPNIADRQGSIGYSSQILNGSKYSDINDLIISCDTLITDYSGCMFDGLEAGKKVLLYAMDVNEYMKDERDFYFSFDELPFPLTTSINELTSCIENFDEEEYAQRSAEFSRRIGNFNSADSSRKVSEYIVRKIKALL